MNRSPERILAVCITAAAAVTAPVSALAQSATHIQTARGAIATAVWAGSTLFISGTAPSPATPADRAKGTPAVYGDTKTQALSVLGKIEALLKEQGLTMGDVVMMHVYLVADPATGKMDFAGMNAGFTQFFGTEAQPNKPARTTVQVAGLVGGGALIEIDAVAAKPAR
jgi:enamine deaminase RidA (YjgF/YER057c/UK114 family)